MAPCRVHLTDQHPALVWDQILPVSQPVVGIPDIGAFTPPFLFAPAQTLMLLSMTLGLRKPGRLSWHVGVWWLIGLICPLACPLPG